ncbi:hypothetical protein BDZ89DRAFT_1140309 [Hymenopellis radicata]|nr:hypothetical protein BDZ89DRAFT_1140309 [Hymenopellis radicata]
MTLSIAPFSRGSEVARQSRLIPRALQWVAKRPLLARGPAFICISPDPNQYSGGRHPDSLLAEYNICFGSASGVTEKFPDLNTAERANYIVGMNRGRGRVSYRNDRRAAALYPATSPWMRFVYTYDDLYPHKAPSALVGILQKFDEEYNLGTDFGIKQAVEHMMDQLEAFGDVEDAEDDVSDTVVLNAVTQELPPMEYL